MIIRKANLNDYTNVNPILVAVEQHHVRLEPEIFRPIQAYDLVQYSGLVRNENSVILVAENDEGELVGALVAVVGEWPSMEIFHGGRYVVVQELSVCPFARRVGIGKALMTAAEQWATAHGIDRIQLSVWDKNQDAISFYEALGYSPYIHGYQKKINDKE